MFWVFETPNKQASIYHERACERESSTQQEMVTSANFEGNTLTQSEATKTNTHLMTSLVPGLGKRQLHFLPTLEG